jgi:hypothetical protein
MTMPEASPCGTQDTILSGTNYKSRQQYNQQFPNIAEARRYAAESAIWIGSILKGDNAGIYYPIALTCTERLPWSIWCQRFVHACVETSRQRFPELSPSNSSRHHSDKSVAIIVLLAESASGLPHAHGLVRIPALAIRADPELVPITIQESSAPKIIEGPPALKTFAANLRNQFHPRPGRSTSLWIANYADRPGTRAEAADHLKYPQRTADALAYLQNTSDGELREWANAALLPTAVFKRICLAAAKNEA